MTRGARRQFWYLLENFWQELFSLHGCAIGDHSDRKILTTIMSCQNALRSIEGLNLMHDQPPWSTIDTRLGNIVCEETQHIDAPVSPSPKFYFGLWCLSRLLELCQDESRPDLWGKYSLVLNRLQWLLPILVKEKDGLMVGVMKDIVRLLASIETNIKSRKGLRGTGAGDIAFPKVRE